MQTTVVLCAVIGLGLSKPEGYYHQAYNYQTSSSSYKNQELQRRNEDKGFYSQEGDLEGRYRPRVNSHSQHSEYVNPNLKQGYGLPPDRSASYGQLYAENHFRPGEPPFNPELERAANFGQSNLRQVTMELQQELEREMQRAVYDHYRRASAYTNTVSQSQAEADMRIIQEELRRNMTMRLQDVLKRHYGTQGIRGGHSYTILNGRLQPVANYHNEELAELTRRMEEHLMRELQQQIQTYYHTTVNTEVHTQRNTYRRVNGNYPSPIHERPPIYHPYPQQVQIPVHIPDSITTIATRVQTELNEHLNRILEDTQKRYFSNERYVAHTGVNFDAILAQLQEELRANITLLFDDQIKRTYGHGNYAVSKYSLEDVENLRRQIETNLFTKLNRDFNKQREKFFQTHVPNTPVFEPPRPIPGNMYYPPPNNYHYQDLTAIHRQMQENLSRQLQSALMQHSYRQAHMYAGANFNPQASYQTTLDQLTAELNRNLTRQMERFYNERNFQGTYGVELTNMKNQLQQELMRQLQQGLQQSYSRYSSWSSSSSSSHATNYRPVRGFDSNLYRASDPMIGEDCMMGDDPSVYQQQTQDQQDQDLTQQIQTHDALMQQNQQQDQDLTQQVQTHDDLTQQSQQLDNQDLSQQVQTSDLTQQVQDLTQQAQTHDYLTQQSQQLEDQELTQLGQTHDYLTQPSQRLEDQDLVQQVQNHDLTQQVQDLTQQGQTHDYLTQQSQQLEDQEVTQQGQTHDDLTQQTQQLNNQDLTQQVQTSDLTQQVQDLTQQAQTHDYLTQQSQQLEDQELTQQGQTHDYLTQPSQRLEDQDLVQQVQNHDLTQQVQDLTQQAQTHDYLTQQNQQLQDQELTQNVQNQGQTHDYLTQLGDQELTQQIQPQNHLTQQTQPLENQRFTQQAQSQNDLTQQSTILNDQQVQTHDGLTQQIQTPDDEDLTQHLQSHDDLTRQYNQDLTQQVQNPHDSASSYRDYHIQQPQHLSQQPQAQNTLNHPENLTPVGPRGLEGGQPRFYLGPVNHRRRYYQNTYSSQQLYSPSDAMRLQVPTANSQRMDGVYSPEPQQNNYRTYIQKPAQQSHDQISLGQQSEDLTAGNLEQLGQQTDDSDLTQQVQSPDPHKLQNQQFQQTQFPTGYNPSRQHYHHHPSGVTSANHQLYPPHSGHGHGAHVPHRQTYLEPTYSPNAYTGYQRFHPHVGQQIDPGFRPNNWRWTPQQQGLTQQTQDIHFSKPTPLQTQLGQQTQQTQSLNGIGQQTENVQNQDQLGQRTEDVNFGNLRQQNQLGQQGQSLTGTGQQTEDLGGNLQYQDQLGQQTEDIGFSNLQQQQQGQLGQTQQIQDMGFGQPYPSQTQVGRQTQQTQPLTGLGQQTEDINYGNWQHYDQFGNLQQPQTQSGQIPGLSHVQQQNQLGQQTEDIGYNKLQRQDQLGQETEDVNIGNIQQNQLGQQTEDNSSSKLQQSQLENQTGQLDEHELRLLEPGLEPAPPQDITQQQTSGTDLEKLGQQTDDLINNQRILIEDFLQNEIYVRRQHTQDNLSKIIDDQKNQDLTQQTQNEDFQNLAQQQSEILTDQKTQDVEQPIEPQISTNNIFQGKPSPQNEDLTQQVEEVSTDSDLFQQNEDAVTSEYSQENRRRLAEAQRESQQLIDQLRNQVGQSQQSQSTPGNSYTDDRPLDVERTRQLTPHNSLENQDNQEIGPMQYHPRPVYANIQGHPTQVGTTRQLDLYNPSGQRWDYNNQYPNSQIPGSRSVINKPNQVNYATVEEEQVSAETVRDIEPVEPQVAHEVQGVKGGKPSNINYQPALTEIHEQSEVEQITTTTEEPGFWKRLGKNIKNKAISLKEKIG